MTAIQTTNSTATETLEQKIMKFKELLAKIEKREVGLQDSFALLDELTTLKQEIEDELTKLETKLVKLTSMNISNNVNL
jgi:exonuclease VII small subunit